MSQRPPGGSAPDPIGAASARLYAAGVERQQRLLCLRFLGILLAAADDEGHVHTDPDDLAGLGLLHGMTAEEANRSRVLLETFHVLDREPTGWFIRHFAPVGDEVPPADALAAISRALAAPTDDALSRGNSSRNSTAISSEQREPEVVPMEPARTRLARRWLAAPVGAVAAAAVVVVALMVSGQVRTPLNSSPASNSNQSAVGAGATATTSAPGEGPVNSAPPLVQSPSTGSGAGTAPSATQAPATPVAGAQPPAQVVCPVGSVSATVDHMSQHIDGSAPSSIAISLGPIVHTTVEGSVHNTSPSTVVVNPFPVTVNFSDPAGKTTQTVTATALSRPTLVGAGAQIPWTITVQNPKDTPVAGTANAAQPTWRWDDARLAAACPH